MLSCTIEACLWQAWQVGSEVTAVPVCFDCNCAEFQNGFRAVSTGEPTRYRRLKGQFRNRHADYQCLSIM